MRRTWMESPIATGVASCFVLVGVLLVGADTAGAAPAAPAAAAAAAQASCDPAYGCPPATPPRPSVTCSVSATTVVAGQSLTAHIEGVVDGTTVSLLFDGAVVGSATVRAKPAQATGGADITFTVPPDTPQGVHSLIFTGADVRCDATGGAGLSVVSGAAVAGEVLERQAAGAVAGRKSGGGGGGSLARTGLEVGLLVAVALGLLAVGWRARQSARRRRTRLSPPHPHHVSRR